MILYTDIDEQCCQWLENLIRYGALPKGDVLCEDIKSVERVDPKYHQIHWCCGIGGWPLAFQLAGWHPERPVVSVSAPCQPFSQAGKQAGTSDPRHLWPHIFRLLQTFRPPLIVGEQVSGAAGYGWFDGVASDLEGEDYACRAIDAPSCSVDAPHIRSRLYWIAALSGHGAAVADPRLLDGRTRPGLTQDRQIGPDGYGSERSGVAQGDTYGARRAFGRKPLSMAQQPTAERTDARYGNGGVDQVDAQSLGRGEGRTQPILRSGWPGATSADAPSDVADPMRAGRDAGAHAGVRSGEEGSGPRHGEPERLYGSHGQGDVADAVGQRLHGQRPSALVGATSSLQGDRQERERLRADNRQHDADRKHDGQSDVADAHVAFLQREPPAGQQPFDEPDAGNGIRSYARNGTFWSGAEWLACHDGKARRTQPGLPLLVNGVSGRVAVLRPGVEREAAQQEDYRWVNRIGAWRGFGNAINPEFAKEVILAYLESEQGGY